MMQARQTPQARDQEPAPRENDFIVRMFLRSYARMEAIYKRASYSQLHAYASYGPFFMLFWAGFVLSSVAVMMIVSAYPPGAATWARSLWIWLLIALALVWAVDRLIDRRIAHISKGERPNGIEEFHTTRERLKWIAEVVALVAMTYVLHESMTRIYF
jgi:hypothetical protein